MKNQQPKITRLNKKDRKRIAQKLVKRMRKDVGWLLKPRPFFMTNKMWVWAMSQFLYLDNNSIKTICSISSSTEKKTMKKQTL